MKRTKRASARAVPRPAPRSTPPVARETPLQWLRRRKDKSGRPLLTQMQFQAGEKLAEDYGHAQLQPRVTANWSGLAPCARTRRSAPGVGVEMRDAVVAAGRPDGRLADYALPARSTSRRDARRP